MTKIRYRAVVHDGPQARTMEQQMWLLASAAGKVWEQWADARASIPDSNPLHQAMRALYHELRDTDLFMAGRATDEG